MSRQQDSGSTFFRTVNFFVRVFAPRSRAGALTGTQDRQSEWLHWVSAERRRLLAAQTRVFQRIDTFSISLRRDIPIPGWLEGLVVVLILGAVLVLLQVPSVFHATYTPDEGTLMANAEAVLRGKITPYLYDYSQPPLSWIQIAGWAKLTGGIASFGNAINSGRVLMLIMAIIGSLLLYLITRRLSGSRGAALLAVLLYTLSPLSLLFRDQVLLYNIGTFWLLLSLWLVTNGKSRLGAFALAAAALGIAVLSDVVFLIFLPVMLYAVSLYATSFQRKFSLVSFAYIALAVSSVYVLLALLKGELFPSGNPAIHPSLIETFVLKLRSAFQPYGNPIMHPNLIKAFLLKTQNPLANQQSDATWQGWLQTDWLLILAGIGAIFLNLLGGTVNRFQLLAAFLGMTFWVVLILSNVWYPYAIVPLLPFLALNIAIALNTPLRWVTRHVGLDLARIVLLFVMIGVLVPSSIQYARPLLAPNRSQPQQQAMTWVRDNVPRNAVLDPAIAGGQLKENWQNISFLIVDTNMLKTIREDRRFIMLNEALHHAALRVSFGSARDGTQIQIYQVIRV